MQVPPYITIDEILKGREVEYPLSLTYQTNLRQLHAALNAFRWIYDKSLFISSGYRPGHYNKAAGGAKASAHLSCEACDFADPKGELDQWCIDNPEVLKHCRLWVEPAALTPNWCHLTIRPVPAWELK